MGFGYTPIAASTAAVANRFVTSTTMRVGTYTLANSTPTWAGGCLVTVTHTTATGTDTLGTIEVVGIGLDQQAQSETITPLADTVATGLKVFRSITSITGVGWVQQGGVTDTIVMGVAAGNYVVGSSGTLRGIAVNSTAAATVVIADKRGTIATLAASIANGFYAFDVDFSGWLRVATTSTNDITVVHSGTLPSTIAT